MLKKLAGLFLFLSVGAQAEVISNGNLTITVRNDNGAIDSYVMDGVDYFGQGSHVSDWGIQIGTDTSTFRLNNTNGSTSIPVTVTKTAVNKVEVTGVINWSGKNVAFTRSIIVSQDKDAMLFSYNFKNNDTMDPVEISIFETFDPDQGISSGNGYGTYNDVVSFGSLRVAQAVDRAGLTFMIGTTDSRMTLAAGSPFRINNGNGLNNFFVNPYDGEGNFDDEGVHLGLRVTLDAEEEVDATAAAASAQNAGDSVVGDAINDLATDLVGDILDTDPVVELIDTIQEEEQGGTLITQVTESSEENGGALWWLLMAISLAAVTGRRRFKQ